MNEKVDASDDDKEIAVLVIDSTGAFKGHKVADTDNGTTVTDGTYVSGDATVKAADSAIVTGAAATYNSKDGKMTVQLSVAKEYTAKVNANGVDKTAIIGDLTNNKVQVTVECDKGDKVVVTVADGAFTK